MSCNNYYRAKLILESNKKRWLKVNENLTDCSGVYILTRKDENGINYFYVGQAKHILTRLAQHLMQYQHIDISLKKHKLYDKVKTPYGWKVEYIMATEDKLDELEQKEIKHYLGLGYQTRNKTLGSQGKGKVGINDDQTTKGYRDGLKQGYKNCLKDIREYFDKYLEVRTQPRKEAYKKAKKGELPRLKEIYIKKFNEFKELLWGEEEK